MSADVTAQESVDAGRVAEVRTGRRVPRRRMPVALTITLGLVSLTVLLAALSRLVGLAPVALVIGSVCGVALSVGLARAASRAGSSGLGPADGVTVGRAVLACGVAALTAELIAGHPVTPAILVLAIPALGLDAVDGWLARRTGTATTLGARLDGEVDAFLILVLSVAVGSVLGWWVVVAGLARYVFALAGILLPWMRRPLPYRYWRKIVTAAVGVGLVIALIDLLPPWTRSAVVLAALALLAESFGRDVVWLWRRRAEEVDSAAQTPRRTTAFARVVGTGLAVLAAVVVWFALLAPTRPDRITPLAFARLPVEALVVAGLVLVLASRSARSARLFSGVAGALLGLIAVLKVLDIGAFAVLDRPFTVVTDLALLGSGLDFVRESAGPWAARGALLGAGLVAVVALVGVPLAAARLVRVLTRRPRAGAGVVLALAVAWVVLAATGIRLEPGGGSVASVDGGRFAVDKVTATVDAIRDQRRFERAIADDAFRQPASGELSALQGKDVVVVFVESYGRAALEGPDMAPVRALLDAGTEELAADGYRARSAYLTSPTFGGSSWLAHASLMSGLWVDDQQRYERVLSSSRSTITSIFARNGWRTVAVLPSNREPWPEGQRFYDVDTVYDRTNLGYAGPSFGFSGMPDQFALTSFMRQELTDPTRPPVMAHVALTSSHGPWAPLPTAVDPSDLGDGSVFESIRAEATSAADLWSDRDQVPDAYRSALQYSLRTVLDFIRDEGDGMVVLLVGDHQPGTIVSGFGGNRDVPVTVIADDPAVLERIDGWSWEAGLRPSGDAPVLSMDEFRDRFLTTYSEPEGGR
ncbi:CDP-alcohol phosphatidyltransferase [Nostocoides sp. F2B08]|uniref:CDP-alcohol phosphatidyltransferase family protein n=1 Tax=Nostocoides sp. F2B08 TaxID=2653936 RepID=UPI00126302F0|nr:CDP-alcohol phosphatidyltransferase family protein [Tetrasphaera sp. F2B08]KAB7743900.1 CDP-alcohol phosphatidyltransferase [Tetrasphaera sp. F2B08]